jgi:ATP-binding cassette subfamily B protein
VSRRVVVPALAHAGRAVRLFVRPNARRVLGTLAGALAVAMLGGAEPLILKQVVDRLAAAAGRHAAPRELVLGVALFAAVLAARIVTNAWVTVSTWRVRLNIEYQLRSRVAAKLSVISGRTQAAIGTGGLRYAIDASAPQTAAAFTDVAFRLSGIVVYLVIAAVSMARLDGRLTAIVLALVPIPALVAALRARGQTRRDRTHQRHWTRLWAWYTEVLHGMATVRAFAQERTEERRFTRRVRWAFASIQRGIHVDAQVTAAASLAELLARAAVLGYGGLLVVRGELSVGALVAFLGYVGGVFAPVQQLVDLSPTLRKAGVALASVFTVLDADEESPDVPGAEPCPPIRGTVRFERVRFAYGSAQPALEGFDLAVAPGETIALVGPSGGGKSTVLRLLQRIHTPDEGRVLVDDHDLRALQIASVRRQLGVVPQDVVLFNDSVAANISYGRPSATRAAIVAAATLANAHDFIMAMPRGYDSRVGEGGRDLSGGQRQRIAIARAFLVDPRLLLLDEATAALDTESELAVQDALRTLCRGRTTFIVAHRLATVRHADRIVVVNDGRIVALGPHDRLIATCALYARLVRAQMVEDDTPASPVHAA